MIQLNSKLNEFQFSAWNMLGFFVACGITFGLLLQKTSQEFPKKQSSTDVTSKWGMANSHLPEQERQLLDPLAIPLWLSTVLKPDQVAFVEGKKMVSAAQSMCQDGLPSAQSPSAPNPQMWSSNHQLRGLSYFVGGYPVWRCVKARQKNVEYPSQPFAVFPMLSSEIFRWILAGTEESKCGNSILTNTRTGKHTSKNYVSTIIHRTTLTSTIGYGSACFLLYWPCPNLSSATNRQGRNYSGLLRTPRMQPFRVDNSSSRFFSSRFAQLNSHRYFLSK